MGYRHSRDDILAGALAVAVRTGLSQLSYGRVAKHLGINDRTIVYYFPTKDDLVTEVLTTLGAQLQSTLAPAFSSPRTDHIDVVRAAWPLLAQPAADPTFALFFEAIGLAAAGLDPYRRLVPTLVEAWIDWTAELIGGAGSSRRAEAATAVAIIDGLLLLRHLAGNDTADQAAHHITTRIPDASE